MKGCDVSVEHGLFLFSVKNRLGFAALSLTFRYDKQDKRKVLLDLRAVMSGSDEALHSSMMIEFLQREGLIPLDHTERIRWEEFQTALRGKNIGGKAREK